MPQTIWKFPIKVTDWQFVKMPSGARILTVQTQRNPYETPCLWALVDESAALEMRMIRTFGTGQPIEPKLGWYIGTYQMDGGQLVFHVFEEVTQ